MTKCLRVRRYFSRLPAVGSTTGRLETFSTLIVNLQYTGSGSSRRQGDVMDNSIGSQQEKSWKVPQRHGYYCLQQLHGRCKPSARHSAPMPHCEHVQRASSTRIDYKMKPLSGVYKPYVVRDAEQRQTSTLSLAIALQDANAQEIDRVDKSARRQPHLSLSYRTLPKESVHAARVRQGESTVLLTHRPSS